MLNNINTKKISLWLSITALACFAVATLLFFQIDMKNFKDNKYQYEVNEEKFFTTEEIKDINIDSSSSDINIIEYDDNKVKVHVYGKLYSNKKTEENIPVIELTTGTLSIMQDRQSATHWGVNFNIGVFFSSKGMKIDLFIPKGYRENMKIDSSSGSVKADSLMLKEFDISTFSGDITLKDVTADTVNLETSSGDISAGNIESKHIKIKSFSGHNNYKSMNSKKVYVESSSGDLTLGTVNAEEITVDTFSGNITAEEIKSEDADISASSGKIKIGDATIKRIKCETFSGDVTIGNAALNDTEIDTSSGKVALRLIEGSEFSLEANSSSGNVSCEFPIITTEEQGENEIKGIVGKDSNTIKIDTFSGDIKISK